MRQAESGDILLPDGPEDRHREDVTGLAGPGPRSALAGFVRPMRKARDEILRALGKAMTRSATDVMQEIIFSAVVHSLMALKADAKGLPNTLLRDINAVHANTTFPDLPKALQAAIAESVRAAFTRMLKEGYSVSPSQSAPPAGAAPRREGAGKAHDEKSRPAGRKGAGLGRPARNGGRPGRRPRPQKPR